MVSSVSSLRGRDKLVGGDITEGGGTGLLIQLHIKDSEN